jgi:hypothetical protein
MDKLNVFLDKLIQYLNSVEGFAKEQLPDFVNQFLTYEMYKASLWFYSLLVILILLVLAQSYSMHKTMDKKSGEEWVPVVFFTGLIGTIVLIACISNFLDMKKIEMAPKVYLIEEFKDYLK